MHWEIPLLTPRDAFIRLMTLVGKLADGPIVVYDDDHYYMGSVIAERLAMSVRDHLGNAARHHFRVGYYTYDRWRAQSRLMEIGKINCIQNPQGI